MAMFMVSSESQRDKQNIVVDGFSLRCDLIRYIEVSRLAASKIF